MLFSLCSNTCLIEEIEQLAQKTYGIRSYANAFPEALDQARRDHIEMIEALRASRRKDLIALARRHLKPSQEAYIRAYERRFGYTNHAIGILAEYHSSEAKPHSVKSPSRPHLQL